MDAAQPHHKLPTPQPVSKTVGDYTPYKPRVSSQRGEKIPPPLAQHRGVDFLWLATSYVLRIASTTEEQGIWEFHSHRLDHFVVIRLNCILKPHKLLNICGRHSHEPSLSTPYRTPKQEPSVPPCLLSSFISLPNNFPPSFLSINPAMWRKCPDWVASGCYMSQKGVCVKKVGGGTNLPCSALIAATVLKTRVRRRMALRINYLPRVPSIFFTWCLVATGTVHKVKVTALGCGVSSSPGLGTVL